MADAPLTNVPDGINLSEPHKGSLIVSIGGNAATGETWPEGIDYEVHADGTVTCPPGWAPVIVDGYIKSFSVCASG